MPDTSPAAAVHLVLSGALAGGPDSPRQACAAVVLEDGWVGFAGAVPLPPGTALRVSPCLLAILDVLAGASCRLTLCDLVAELGRVGHGYSDSAVRHAMPRLKALGLVRWSGPPLGGYWLAVRTDLALPEGGCSLIAPESASATVKKPGRVFPEVQAMTDTDTTTLPALLTQTQAMEYLGMSKARWYRLLESGLGPRPVRVPGSVRPAWRREDLDLWVRGLEAQSA